MHWVLLCTRTDSRKVLALEPEDLKDRPHRPHRPVVQPIVIAWIIEVFMN
jgi:hypothetical protein